jgi:ubiquinone/menaquinone biosynthesis C-methylase UbiE
MTTPELQKVLDNWQLPKDGPLLGRIEQMMRPALMKGLFGSQTEILCGLQYHLGGEQDTTELAQLAALTADDHLLDVCSYIGGPVFQLVDTYQCQATGIDISEDAIAVAKRITELAGLSYLAAFCVADAGNLPFADGEFTVVWNQCSLMHYDSWLQEFDRVLAPGGRLAITFEIGHNDPREHDSRWSLQNVARFVEQLGYTIEHVSDISERDIEIGWQALDRKLSEQEEEYTAYFGEAWVCNARTEFANEIVDMRAGKWGNGRLVAIKTNSTIP